MMLKAMRLVSLTSAYHSAYIELLELPSIFDTLLLSEIAVLRPTKTPCWGPAMSIFALAILRGPSNLTFLFICA
jgi:hypothetical protein